MIRAAVAGTFSTISTDHLSWAWIVLSAILPLILGVLVAFPFWRKAQPIFGNLVATAVIFTWGIAMIMREHVQLDRLIQACADEDALCWPHPDPFTRFAIYASIALVEVIAIFWVSLRVEEKLRRRGYDPEWR